VLASPRALDHYIQAGRPSGLTEMRGDHHAGFGQKRRRHSAPACTRTLTGLTAEVTAGRDCTPVTLRVPTAATRFGTGPIETNHFVVEKTISDSDVPELRERPAGLTTAG
jgi:hypothetical protein